MKVLFVFGILTHYLPPLLNSLSEKGLEIVVLLPCKKSATVGKGVKANTQTTNNFKIIYSDIEKNILQKEYFPQLPNILSKEKPDIFVVGFPYFIQYFLQSKLRKIIKREGIKFVIREIPFQVPPWKQIRTYFRNNPMYNENMQLRSKGSLFLLKQTILMYIRKYCYTHCDGILPYSSVAYDIIPSYGINKKNIFVTYNTTDTDSLFSQKERNANLPSPLPKNKFRIIHVGRLVKWKRVDLLLDALKIIIKKIPSAELIIIGSGPEKERLIQQVKNNGLEQNVQFLGNIYDATMLSQYYLASRVYVLAGMGGLSINEAMAFALPVICSRCDGTEKDLVYDGKNGYYFKENDANDLSKKIINILNDDVLCENMGKASLQIIKDKINIQTVSQRYIAAFKEIKSKGD